jgi:precorrin-3B synthase
MSARRGWCPDIHTPMPSGDGFLVRIKPPHARLSVAMAHAIAEAAQDCGSGVIELTSRANLQLRGLRAVTLDTFARAMTDCGAAAADAGLERRRNLIISPLADSDPDVHPATLPVAAAIVACLQHAPHRTLPGKYGFVVDGGGSRPLRGVPGDVVIRLGVAASAASPVGYLGYRTSGAGSFGLAPAFGQTSADALRALSGLAARHGDGLLRVGPWRTFLVGGVPPTEAAPLSSAAAEIGFITDPADPRLRINACPGAPACASGQQPARQDAAALAAVLGAARVHVSGCTKGCAHSGPADYTFVGEAQGYALVRHGRAADPAVSHGLQLADCLAALRAA